jgi:hypothetical protein
MVAGVLTATINSEADRSDGLDSEGVKDRASILLSRIEAQAGRTISRGTRILATIRALHQGAEVNIRLLLYPAIFFARIFRRPSR